MIRVYFGKPGCGKTSKYAQLCYHVAKAIDQGKCKYKYVVGNVDIVGLPHYYKITFDTIGLIGYPDALILIDEATLEADSRRWSKTPKELIDYLVTHRHWCNDMFWFAQIWDRVDSTVKDLTEEVIYLHKGLIIRGWTRETRIGYGILIPKVGEDKPGEIICGYIKPGKIAQIFEPRFFRRPYYKYFNSFSRPDIPVFKCQELGNLPDGSIPLLEAGI